MSKKGFLVKMRRFTSLSLAGLLLGTAFMGTDAYYNYGPKVYAAELVSESNGTSGDQTIKGGQNLGNLDNSGDTTYWYAGNAFYGMKRSGVEFGEDYDSSDWLLVDTDAMWGGNYLYSTWGNGYQSNGSDLYTTSEDAAGGSVADVNKVYYQKILTYGERLWSQYGSSWFTGKEASAVGTATVTTTNNSYRTFEDYVGGATKDIGNYNYWIGATTADNIASGNYTINKVKKWYETGSTDTTKYGTLNAAQNATTYANKTNDFINTSNYNGITEGSLGVKSSNIYTVLGAHLYAPSVGELEANESVYKRIVQNLRADYTAETTDTGGWAPNGGWYSAAKSKAAANPSVHLWDRTRTYLWSRSFSGLHVYYSYFGAWYVNVDGYLDSSSDLTGSLAVAPAFNLDTSSVVMAHSAQATVSPSSELASYNPNSLGGNVTFSLESNALSINTAIAGQKLKNVVAGQTYDIAYSGASVSGEAHNAQASANLFVSAGIYDADNNLVYYGQLAPVSSEGSGTVSVTVPENLEAGKDYKLAIFEEQINGTYNVNTPSGKSILTYTTDYVSAMNVATFTLDSLTAQANEGAALNEETRYNVNDIAGMITVTSAAQGELAFGTDYTIKSVKGNATVDGTNITTGDNGSKKAKELVFEIAYADENMAVVPGTTVTLVVNSSTAVDDNTYQNDQDAKTDENGFFTWRDDVTGIEWKYKTDSAGNVISLYTVNDPSPLIDAAGTLNLPKTVAGLTVIGIGGGTESTPVVSMGDGDWTSISFPETVTTVNDYAFVNARQENANIIIPKYITTVGAKAFYKSSIKSLKVNGATGNIGYLAFGNCQNLTDVTIRGLALTLDKESFSGSGITNLSITGTVFIKENAFKDVTGITTLYLPNGVDAYADAFSGCTGITTLESGMSVLYNNSFSGCTSIDTVILDDTVQKVEYDWNGHISTLARTYYVKNENTKFQFYGKDNEYISAYGTSGEVTVVYDGGTDEGTRLTADDKGILTAITKTLANHSSNYQKFYKGLSSKVSYVYNGAKSTEQIMEDQSVTDINVVSETQTGIEVTFDGTLLTTQPIDKSKVSVSALFGNILGEKYDSSHFYVIRSEEFNSLSRKSAVTEEAVAAFEPLTAQDEDLQNGLSAAIIVFTNAVADGDGVSYTDIEDNGYFYATISVRVEKYSDKDYVESKYGSYTEIANQINGLTSDIENMEKSMKDIITKVNTALGTSYDVNASDLTTEYKNAVQALSNALAESVSEKDMSIGQVKALVDAVNTMYGTSIELPENATAEQINNAVTLALKAISDDQTEKNNTITALKQQYVAIAQLLSDYMSDTENMTADAVDGTTINDIKKAISKALSDLNAANKELADIDAALNNLYNALNNAIGGMSDKKTTLDTSLGTNDNGGTASLEETTADKINSITGMINTLSSSYEANNAFLRDCIAQIDDAFGYGQYVKYSDKYVFYYQNTNSATNGMPESIYYIKNGSRIYLTTEDGVSFTEVEDQTAYKTAFDAVNGVKFFHLEDTVNGWNPYQTNPLSDYKQAMAALLNGFEAYNDQTVRLIATVNSICGYQPGDANYLEIPDNATTDQITGVMSNALDSVNTQLKTLNAQNIEYGKQYAEAAKALNEFLENEYSDSVSSEDAATITKAVRQAVAELTKLRSEMSDIDRALENLFSALQDAYNGMGLMLVDTKSLTGNDVLDTNLDTDKTGGNGESTADKIESISGMIAIITNNYNQLNQSYTNLQNDYQNILDYVYGEDEKFVGQVSSAQVKAQIDKNQQAAVDKAVEEALANAGSLNADAQEVQTSIAETIDKIMDGEEASTAGMAPELAEALGQVHDMKASVDSMQSAVDGYVSVLSTIQTALGLDNTATSAEIIAAISGLKDQVAELSAKVDELTAENAKLKTETTTSGSYDEGYAAGVASVDTSDNSDTYKRGYTAGHAAGVASVDKSGDYQSGYTKGYAEGAASVDTSTNSTTYKNGYAAGVASVDISENGSTYKSGYAAGFLAGQNSSNSSSNSTGKDYSTGYKEGYSAGAASVDTSANGVTYKTGYNAGYSAGVASVDTSTKSTTYTSGYNAGYIEGFKEGNKGTSDSSDSKIKDLTSKVTALTDKNKTLSDNVNSLDKDNTALKDKVTSLGTTNTALESKVKDLNSTVSTLKSDKSSLSQEVSNLKSQVETLQKTKTTATPSTTSTNNYPSNTSNNASTSTSATTSNNTSSNGTSASSKTGAQSTTKTNSNASTESSEESQIVRNSALVPQSTDTEGEKTTSLSMPTSAKINTVSSDQKAETTLKKLTGDGDVTSIKTNATTLNVATSGQKDMAYLILNYYMNHLDELGELGSDEVKSAAINENATVSFEVVSALDVEPSEEQLDAISENGRANLTLTSSSFADGDLYLVIHESEKREDTYDVLLTEIEDNTISMSLPDFSPVTIAKINVTELENVQLTTQETETENAQLISEAPEEEAPSNNGFRIVMYILLIVAFCGLGALVFIMKKQPDWAFKNRKK